MFDRNTNAQSGGCDSLRKAALEHPDYPLLYLSEDSQYGGIIIRTDFGTHLKPKAEEDSTTATAVEGSTTDDYGFGSEEDTLLDLSGTKIEVVHVGRTAGLPEFQATEMEEYVSFAEALYEILNKPEYTKHLEYHPVGMAEIMHFMMDMMMTELGFIAVGSILLILLTLALLFRSFSGMVWPTLLVVITTLWVIGGVGWTAMEMSSMVSILGYVILAMPSTSFPVIFFSAIRARPTNELCARPSVNPGWPVCSPVSPPALA